ncbi:twin-arginine translocase subunit TatC [Candidatus Mycosynbacter amalyticus]|uniref:Sec-independent protein translocase protein TatC n=1 Tax=Candidatus Mycosynbacter amalyticus TaxID=2665156 RepID=A0A857MKW0_9BACT|nr:twin-arginine translocase subunit TatC [Candidatus Mycosynbacter amalyticus]QHN43203.1 twin-arginine translocase subunit TatC [Candidatus Mycosynbacter amalyticus]
MMTQRRRKKTPKQNQTTLKSQSSSAEDQQTFLEHLYELRSRLFWITASLIVTSAIGFQYKDTLVSFVMAPLHGEKLVYLTPGGGFSFIFTVCLYFGAFVTIPVVVYHIYRFLQPVLGRTSRRLVAAILLLSALLALSGAAFGYYIAVPAAIQFLTTFAGDAVTPNLTAESYLGFIVAYMLGLAALFQLPLLLYMFDHVRPFPPGTLLSSQRFVIVGAVIAAALITPTPDIVNQMIVALPIILIYQLGAIAVYVRRTAGRRRAARAVTQPEETAEDPVALLEPEHTLPVEAAERAQEQIQEVSPPAVQADAPAKAPALQSSTQAALSLPRPVTRAGDIARPTAMRRSLDGFTRRPTTIPARQVAQESQRRPSRSIDGLSLV